MKNKSFVYQEKFLPLPHILTPPPNIQSHSCAPPNSKKNLNNYALKINFYHQLLIGIKFIH